MSTGADTQKTPAPGMLDRLLGLFSEVHAGEGRRAFLMLLNVFLILVAYYIIKTVREPLILGTEVPGFKLVEGKQGNRAWVDQAKAEAALKALRLKADDMYDKKLISPTTAEKLLKTDPKKWAKLQELITRASGKPSVAPSSDKRPELAVHTATARDFAEFTK